MKGNTMRSEQCYLTWDFMLAHIFVSLFLPQGVVEFSLCLLFAKLVSYTFLYWLPLYIVNVGKFQEASNILSKYSVCVLKLETSVTCKNMQCLP